MKEPIHSKPNINVRIAPELYEMYKKIAERNGRSITSQINFTLRRTLPIELHRSFGKELKITPHAFRHTYGKQTKGCSGSIPD